MAELVYGEPIDYQRIAEEIDQHPHFVKRLLDTYATKEEFTARTGTRSAPTTTSDELGSNVIRFDRQR
jgi:hypothetical protein